MLTSGSPFSSREDPGKLLGQILVSREESTAQAESSACVLEGNAQRTSEAMSPAQIARSVFLPLAAVAEPRSPLWLGRRAGRCSGSGRSCAGSRDPFAGMAPAAGRAGRLPPLLRGGEVARGNQPDRRWLCKPPSSRPGAVGPGTAQGGKTWRGQWHGPPGTLGFCPYTKHQPPLRSGRDRTIRGESSSQVPP